MTDLHAVAVSARAAALCLARPGTRYHLHPPRPWRLTAPGQPPREGAGDTAILVLHDLAPATAYRLEVEGAALAFATLPCAGLVEAADHGIIADDPAEAAANAARLARAVEAVPPGGTLRLPAGRWYALPLALKDNMTLALAAGAVLAAPAGRQGWPILPARDAAGRMLGSWEGLPAACFKAPLHAIGARGVTITGPGTLDGGGAEGDWWQWPKETREGARRPRGLHLVNCRDVLLLGFTIRNAPSWTVHPQGCAGLTAAGLVIEAPHDSPNTDGFDPESCTDVRLEGLRFSVGDDCIAIKAGKRGPGGEADHLAPTARVTIRHCLMQRGHGGVVIGSEMSGDVTDVLVEACEMVGTDRGLRLKTRRGRGGVVRNIRLRNVRMEGVLTALSANAFYHCDADGRSLAVQDRAPAALGPGTPRIEAITVEDLEIHGLSHAAGAFLGLPEAPIRGITLRGLRLVSFDPAASPAPPLMAEGIRPMRHEGLVAEHAALVSDSPALVSAAPVSAADAPRSRPALAASAQPAPDMTEQP